MKPPELGTNMVAINLSFYKLGTSLLGTKLGLKNFPTMRGFIVCVFPFFDTFYYYLFFIEESFSTCHFTACGINVEKMLKLQVLLNLTYKNNTRTIISTLAQMKQYLKAFNN